MSLDLGLNRSSENWILGNDAAFNDRDRGIRDRVWQGCTQLDAYLALFLGRPALCRKSITNTSATRELDSHLELSPWPISTHTSFKKFNPVTAKIASNWNSKCRLAQITFDVLDKLYTIGRSSSLDAIELEKTLATWSRELSPEIVLNTQESLDRATPHALSLHIQKECVMIAIQYPFINLQEMNMGAPSVQALQKAVTCATTINTLVGAYRNNFGFTGASPFISYQIFSAGTIWAAAIALEPQNHSYMLGLSQSMNWLDELKSLWPSAKQHYDLLTKADHSLSFGLGFHEINDYFFMQN